MIKVWISMMLLWLTGSAATIDWQKDYQTAMSMAKMQNKPVMVVISSHQCRYCVKLEQETFSNELVIKGLNRDFISVIAYTDKNDKFPAELWQGGTPTTWFLYPNGEPMFQPLVGYVDPENFIKALSIVYDAFNTQQQ